MIRTRFFVGLSLCSACAALFFAGCGGSSTQSFPQLDEKGSIAVVGYGLNKSIVLKGKDASTGPGLLQKKENYYAKHREAVEDMWRQFTENIGPAFDNATFVSFEEIGSSDAYRELTKHTPKMVMGKDVSVGGSYMSPEQINYVSDSDEEKLAALAEKLDAGLLMVVENSAQYKMHAGVSIGGLGGGAGVMELETEITLWEPGTGVIWNKTYKTSSDEKAPIAQGTMAKKHFPRLLASANEALFEEIKADIAKSKAAAAESATEN
jgi:hypothetical protein